MKTAIVVGGTRYTLDVGTILTHVGPYNQAIQRPAHTSTEEVLLIIKKQGGEVVVFVCDLGEAAEDLYRGLEEHSITVHLFKTVQDIYRILGKQ